MPQGTGSAASVLSALLRHLGPNGMLEGTHKAMAADLQVVDFPHGGQQVRGLSSKAAIKKGQEILSVPQPVMLTETSSSSLSRDSKARRAPWASTWRSWPRTPMPLPARATRC
ncbi:unnamed protein product [Effrenium voratum]|nr:unnamed protein product [Effrenium voratum]